MPVPLALTIVAIAWAYCLGLFLAAWRVSREDDSTKDVQLERGIVQSMTRRSQDSAEIQILVGDVTQVFTAAEGAFAYLAPRDSVMFAYMHQPREIINIATLDVSTPGRVARVGGWKRSGNAELPGRFWQRLLTKEDLYNQAAFGISGGGGSLAVGGMWLGPGDWGWPGWIFVFPVTGMWLVLHLIASSISTNRESMAGMELDVGYVQKVEEGERPVSDTGSVPWQSIAIAETAARDSVNQREYQYDGSILFKVHVGDLVMLSTDADGQILDLRNESRPTLHQPGATGRIHPEQLAEECSRDQYEEWVPEDEADLLDETRRVSATLANLGIDARVLERGSAPYNDDADAQTSWIEIAESPIRWVEIEWDSDGMDTSWLVPDAQIRPDSLDVFIHSEPVKSRPLFGSVKGVRWIPIGLYHLPNISRPYPPNDISRKVAENLGHDAAAAQRMLLGECFDFWVRSVPELCCWRIWGPKPEDVPDWSGWWDCYQAIAEALLAMPMPSNE